MPFFTCLPLIEADLPAVLALDQRCLGGLWTRSGYQRELDSPHSDLQVLVSSANAADLTRPRPADLAAHELASQDIKTSSSLALIGVGCLWAILEEAHITTLVIEPANQGQKLGQLLLCDLLLCGYHRGLTRATLEVRASNQSALSLYQKFGFQIAGERKRYYADGENAQILWCSGLQSEDCLAQIRRYQQEAIAHLSANQHVFLTSDFLTSGFLT
ncbi:MAG: GNAT family N-acetyltransferase [Phormidesmis sp.]